MTGLLAQVAHRRKALVALVVAVASVVVALSADSTAGHVAAAVLALLTGAATHQVPNARKPVKRKKA